jgi:hypothetical protein
MCVYSVKCARIYSCMANCSCPALPQHSQACYMITFLKPASHFSLECDDSVGYNVVSSNLPQEAKLTWWCNKLTTTCAYSIINTGSVLIPNLHRFSAISALMESMCIKLRSPHVYTTTCGPQAHYTLKFLVQVPIYRDKWRDVTLQTSGFKLLLCWVILKHTATCPYLYDLHLPPSRLVQQNSVKLVRQTGWTLRDICVSKGTYRHYFLQQAMARNLPNASLDISHSPLCKCCL